MHVILERVVCQIADEVRGLDAETVQLHPGGLTYKWSVQQVVEHLVLGYRLTSSALETRLQKGHAPRRRQRTPAAVVVANNVAQFRKAPQRRARS